MIGRRYRGLGRAIVVRAVGAVALVALTCCAGGCRVHHPVVRLADIQVSELTFSQAKLVFLLDVTNPNSFDAELLGYRYEFVAGGKTLATGSLPTPLPSFAAGQTRRIRADVNLRLRDLVPILAQGPRGRLVPYEYASVGTFRVAGVTVSIPTARRGKLPALQVPQWRMRPPRLSRKTPGAIELVFEIRNPNEFDLRLEKLSGALRYGSETLATIEAPARSKLPSGQSVQVVVPVRLDKAGLAAVGARLLSGDRGRFRFEGQFRLRTPASLRRLLLREENADAPARQSEEP